MPFPSDSFVFISYARADNEQPNKKTKGWVTYFWDDLRFELTTRGAPEAKLWLDHYQIEPQEAFTPKIEQALKQSKLMLAILSRNWIKREWCLRELELFNGLHANASDRFIPVFKDKIEQESLPTLMQGYYAREGYQFFKIDRTGETYEFYWRGLKDKKSYEGLVKKIALLIIDKLDNDQSTPIPQPVAASSGKTVFIAFAVEDDLRDARQKLVNDLERNGVKVVPEDETPPKNVKTFEKIVKDALSKAVFAVHLLGEDHGIMLEDATEPIVQHQLRLTRETSLHRILWVPRWHRTETDNKRNPADVVMQHFGALQKNEEIFGKEVTDLSQLLRKRLKLDSQTMEHLPTAKLNQILVAAAHPDDEELAIELANEVQGCGLEVQLYTPETYSELALEATLVLIPWGIATKENLQTLFSKLSPAPAKITCLLLPGGNDSEKRQFFQKGIFRTKIKDLPINSQEIRALLESLEVLSPDGSKS